MPTRDELRQAYADAFIELVMMDTATASVDISSAEERAIVIDALYDAMQFFADPSVWHEIHKKFLNTQHPTSYINNATIRQREGDEFL